MELTHCSRCGHSNGNHHANTEAHCLIPECACKGLELELTRCVRCNQGTSEYDPPYQRWCGTCRDEAEADGVKFDLDDEPYRIGSVLGPWRVSYCCWSFSKGIDTGVVCRSCYGDVEHIDGPANIADRFGRTHQEKHHALHH